MYKSEVRKLMARNYQYGTSPRKVEPNYVPKKKTTRKVTKKINKQEENQRQEALKQEKKGHYQNIAMIVGIFLVLLAISYRSSLITEEFNEIQNKKSQLAAVQKTNEQLQVSIESSLNLSNVEKAAKKKLGMKKLDNNQKVFVALPKKDYTETTTEDIQTEEETSWFKSMMNKIFKN